MATATPVTPTAGLLHLQRAAGNRAVGSLLHDPLRQHAVAAGGATPTIYRACCAYVANNCTGRKQKYQSMHNATNAGFKSASTDPSGQPCYSGKKEMRTLSEKECAKAAC